MKKRDILTVSICILFVLGLCVSLNITSGAVTSADGKYQYSELVQLADYLWFMASVGDKLYSAVYSSPQKVYYSTFPFTSWTPQSISSNDESTRVYNLNDKIYITSEGGNNGGGGKVYTNSFCYNFPSGTAYVLGAEYSGGLYLISRSLGSRTDIYSCPCSGGQTCSLWKSVQDMFTFHMTSFNNDLYLIGTSPSNYRTYTGGRVKVIRSNGNVETLLSSGPGSGSSAEVFDNKLFFGFSYDAEIRSYDGLNWKSEKTFPGFSHFGDFEVFNGKLFVAVVREQGNPEIWVRDNDASGGQWNIVFSQQQLSKYGVRGNLVNAAGFFTTHGNKLYFNINSPLNSRKGPGYILEISSLEESCISNWTYSDGLCRPNNTLVRTWIDVNRCFVESTFEEINCTYLPPCSSSDWGFSDGLCRSNSSLVRTWVKKSNCQGEREGGLIEEVNCIFVPPCSEADYQIFYTSPGICPLNGKWIIYREKITHCAGGVYKPSVEEVPCNPSQVPCEFSYSNWSNCLSNGFQKREVISFSPERGCEGIPIVIKECDFNSSNNHSNFCNEDDWVYNSSGDICPASGKREIFWKKISDCEGGVSKPISEEINCSNSVSPCWSLIYSSWGECSSGTRTRRVEFVSSEDNCDLSSIVLEEDCVQVNSDSNQAEDIGVGVSFFNKVFCRLKSLFSHQRYIACLVR